MSRRQVAEVLVGAALLFVVFNFALLEVRVSGPSIETTLRDGDLLIAL